MEVPGNKVCYLLSENKCHGVVKIGNPFKIRSSEFHEYFPKHRCTESQRKKQFGHKEVIFAYPLEIVENYRADAIVSLTMGELFADSYTIGKELPVNGPSLKAPEFDKLSNISTNSHLVVYNKETNTFVINLPQDHSFAGELATKILATLGPETQINYGSDFGSKYIPLYTISGQRINEITEIKNLHQVPDVRTAFPEMKSFEMNIDTSHSKECKRYVVEKKMQGATVRIQCMKGIPEILNMNGKSLTESFPSLAKQIVSLSHGDFIADAVLRLEQDPLVKRLGKQFFKEMTHTSAYYFGLLMDIMDYEDDCMIVTLETEYETLHNLTQQLGVGTVEVQGNCGTFILSDKEVLADYMKILGEFDSIPDRFHRSVLRGVFESTGTLSKEKALFTIRDKSYAKSISAILGRYNLTSELAHSPEGGNSIIIHKEDVKDFVEFLYTAGPSLPSMRASAEEISGSSLCAHPDESTAVLWIHDLLYHS